MVISKSLPMSMLITRNIVIIRSRVWANGMADFIRLIIIIIATQVRNQEENLKK